jgi:hypothetical protein
VLAGVRARAGAGAWVSGAVGGWRWCCAGVGLGAVGGVAQAAERVGVGAGLAVMWPMLAQAERGDWRLIDAGVDWQEMGRL